MAIYIKEASDKLGAEERIIALNIMLVIYLHDRRYSEALREISELLSDPEMRNHHKFLLSKEREIRQDLENSLNKKRPYFLRFILNLL